MSQQAGVYPIGAASYKDVPTPRGNNLAFFLNVDDNNLLYAKKSDGTAFLVPTSNSPLVLPSGQMFVGNASNVSTARAISKDLTMSNTGAATVVGIQGTTVIAGPYTTGTTLYYDGTFWQVLPAGSNGDLLQLSSGVPSWQDRATARGYRVYSAVISQTGVNAPVATVMENSLAGAVTWAYQVPGIYTLNSAINEFVPAKTMIFISPDNTSIVSGHYASNAFVQIESMDRTTGLDTDGLFVRTEIEIRVYP